MSYKPYRANKALIVGHPGLTISVGPGGPNKNKEIFNFQFSIYNQFSMNQLSNSYNLEERTAKFGENIIGFCQNVRQDAISRPIISQLIRSGTSIGANYMEANAASSRKDFRNKIFICKKEAQETKHWLRMIARCFPDKKDRTGQIWKECQELTLIFQKITNSLKEKRNKSEN